MRLWSTKVVEVGDRRSKEVPSPPGTEVSEREEEGESVMSTEHKGEFSVEEPLREGTSGIDFKLQGNEVESIDERDYVEKTIRE